MRVAAAVSHGYFPVGNWEPVRSKNHRVWVTGSLGYYILPCCLRFFACYHSVNYDACVCEADEEFIGAIMDQCDQRQARS